jgi:hypothetical protein
MLKVHREGIGVCGVYPRDVATTKVQQVAAYSRKHQHPLQCVMEDDADQSRYRKGTQGMIAQELEVSLHMAFVEARQKRHEFITVEHLLLALLDNPTAAEVLRACGATWTSCART